MRKTWDTIFYVHHDAIYIPSFNLGNIKDFYKFVKNRGNQSLPLTFHLDRLEQESRSGIHYYEDYGIERKKVFSKRDRKGYPLYDVIYTRVVAQIQKRFIEDFHNMIVKTFFSDEKNDREIVEIVKELYERGYALGEISENLKTLGIPHIYLHGDTDELWVFDRKSFNPLNFDPSAFVVRYEINENGYIDMFVEDLNEEKMMSLILEFEEGLRIIYAPAKSVKNIWG